MPNRDDGGQTKENAASEATEHGVKWCETEQKSHEDNTPKRGRSAMSKWAKPAHKKTARAIGYALTLGDEAAWHGLTIVLMARLSDEERAAMAFAALMSLSDEHKAAVCDAVLPKGAGLPSAPLFGYMDQAAFWADMAEPDELAAYCLASFNAMPRGRQAAFLEHVQGRAAA